MENEALASARERLISATSFLTDQVEKGNLVIKYCPTGSMIADFQTKPLQGAKFDEFRSAIMGFDKWMN